ncbi:hypothetical protein [Haloarcula sp. JP-L23]|uniref:hypothetical protein n=1 Tax=Haloarcula sp. JP-L23 TaxID=2716717 RepID=UPI00140EBE4C|nr:hypothetical protein G9465_10720 [Haloarcula sp. JP-L23]
MFSNNEWDDVPTTRPHENLDYEMEELTVIQSETDEKYVFLPAEESHLLEDAFIVASADALVELRE